jgi:Ala-tRNA(Pro) deacylase
MDDRHKVRALLIEQGRVPMAIATTLQHHLASKHIEYDLVPHPETMSAMRTAKTCHVPAHCLAKGVVVRTKGSYVLADPPASHQIERADLKGQLGGSFSLASERELDKLFPDCAHGAIPPIGECYGVNSVVEDSIREQPDIYFEGGDHTTLVHVAQAQFARLVGNAPHGCFSVTAAGRGRYWWNLFR